MRLVNRDSKRGNEYIDCGYQEDDHQCQIVDFVCHFHVRKFSQVELAVPDETDSDAKLGTFNKETAH